MRLKTKNKWKVPNKIMLVWKLIFQTIKDSVNDDVFKLSAALSYYTIFSLAPLLIIIIRISSLVYGKDAVEGKIFGQIRDFVGSDAALQIQQALQHFHTAGGGYIMTIIGVLTLLIGATAVFNEIQHSVNMIWKIRAKPKKGILKLLVNRLLSFALIIGLCILLIISLTIDGLIQALNNRINFNISFQNLDSVYFVNLILMFIVLTLLFGIIFKVLPDAKITWKNVLAGAVVTAILFLIGKYFLSWYLSQNAAVNAYGAAGSLVLLLLWIYYSSVILFIGAEFTQVYALHSGKRIHPNKYAVFIDTKEIETRISPLEEEIKKIK